MGKIKRILAAALACTMMFTLAACGGESKNGDSGNGSSKNGSGSGSLASKDYVYAMNDLKFDGIDGDYSISRSGDEYVAYKYDYGYDNGSGPILYEEAEVDADVAEAEITGEDKEEIADEAPAEDVDSSGTTVIVKIFDKDAKLIGETKLKSDGYNNSISNLKYSNGKIVYVWEEYGDSDNTYTLKCVDIEGKELWSTLFEPDEELRSRGFYPSLDTIYDNKIIIKNDMGVDLYSLADGSLISSKKVDDVYSWSNCFVDKNNNLISLIYDDNGGMSLKKVNDETWTTEDYITFPEEIKDLYNYNFFPGTVHDLILSDDKAVYTYNIGDTSFTKIMDYVASDCLAYNLYDLIEIDDKSFMATWYESYVNEPRISLFTKVDPKDVPDRQVITFGGMYITEDAKSQIIAFNKKSDKYRIQIKDYSSEFGYFDDFSETVKAINNEIITGKMPDIMCMESYMPAESYQAKGVLEDLMPYIEKDPDIDLNDYYENILRCGGTGNAMYHIVPTYSISTVAAKTSLLGGKTSITMEDLKNIKASKGPDVYDFGMIEKSTFMYFMLDCNMQDYIDWESGEVSFNSDQFVNVLEYTDNYPTELDYESDEMNRYWDNYSTMYIEDRALFNTCGISSLDDIITLKQGMFGNADITYIGYPTTTGSGSLINPALDLVMNAESDCKEGAWEFLRGFLLDDYQDNIEYYLPVKKSSLDKMAEKAMKLPTYEDENGKTIEYHNTYYMNDDEIELEPLSKEEYEDFKKFISTITKRSSSNSEINDIVNEEAAYYYNGQKTAAEVSNVIQSKVKIYVNERM
ncbi:MAG: hypothetical protein K5662_07575 [Lachnospiraceae bacterium]|nr:hypothetical protein [Lachnospiraceae bacterium]